MKAEQYLLQHIKNQHISPEQMEETLGIHIPRIVEEQRELSADEFIAACLYLGISPEEVQDGIL